MKMKIDDEGLIVPRSPNNENFSKKKLREKINRQELVGGGKQDDREKKHTKKRLVTVRLMSCIPPIISIARYMQGLMICPFKES